MDREAWQAMGYWAPEMDTTETTWHAHTGMQLNINLSVLVNWMNLESVIKNEESQKEKNKFCIVRNKYRI